MSFRVQGLGLRVVHDLYRQLSIVVPFDRKFLGNSPKPVTPNLNDKPETYIEQLYDRHRRLAAYSEGHGDLLSS